MTASISGGSRMRRRALPTMLIAGVCVAGAANAFARGGDADLAFGTAGVATLPLTGRGLDSWNLVTAAAGGTVSVGATDSGERSDVEIQRTLDNGQPDASFGVNGRVDIGSTISVFGVAVQPDGATIIAGQPKGGAFSFNPGWRITRLKPDGSTDASFGDAGWSSFAVTGVAGLGTVQVLADGRIVVAMTQDDFSPTDPGSAAEHVTVVRMLANGKPDPSYGVAGIADYAFGDDWPRDTLRVVRVEADGSVDVTHDAAGSLAISRLAPNGSVDRSFGIAGTHVTPMPFTLVPGSTRVAFLPDGSLVVAVDTPDFTSMPPGPPRYLLAIARVSAGGDLQFSFGVAGAARMGTFASEIDSILPTPDGGILLVGGMSGPSSHFEVMKIDAQGRTDASFGQSGSALVAVPVEAFRVGNGVVGADGYLTVIGVHDGGPGSYLARLQAVGDVVEFHNAALDHYFMAYDGAEAAGIDFFNAAGPGWSRTGASFRPGGSVPVCRFYGTPGIGPNSHFYTADPDECDGVKRDPGWTYEGIGFYTTRPANGACTAPLVPVHRLYNDGFAHGVDSNHRYVVDTALVAPMVARGWIHEGVVFCAKP